MPNWKVRVQPDGPEIEVQPGETLMAALRRRAPRLLLWGCRNGGCGVCKIRVVSGEVSLGPCSLSALSHAERAEGLVLACKATPQSDLVVQPLPRPTNRHIRIG